MLENSLPPSESERKEDKSRKIFLDFFELSKEQELLLQEGVEKNNGLIRVFIHPYYKAPEEELEEPLKIVLIDKAIKKILYLAPDKTPPVFIFEEERKINRLRDSFEFEAQFLQNRIYIVPTFMDSSWPKIGSLNGSRNEKQQEIFDREEEWDFLNRRLKELGVKKILMGGMNLYIETKPRPGKIDFCGCVGGAINHLGPEFKVDISNLTLPDGRKQFKQAIIKKNKNLKID